MHNPLFKRAALFFLFSSLFLVLAFIFLKQRGIQLSTLLRPSTGFRQGELKIDITSQLPSVYIIPDTFNEELWNEALSLLTLTDLNSKEILYYDETTQKYATSTAKNLKEIRFTFLPIEEYRTLPQAQISSVYRLDATSEPYYVIAIGKLENNILTIPIYIDAPQVKEKIAIPMDLFLTHKTLISLYIHFSPSIDLNVVKKTHQELIKDYELIIKNLTPNTVLFRVDIQSLSMLELLIPSAYAACNTSSIGCGNSEVLAGVCGNGGETCACDTGGLGPYSGASCSGDESICGLPPYTGTCQCTSTQGQACTQGSECNGGSCLPTSSQCNVFAYEVCGSVGPGQCAHDVWYSCSCRTPGSCYYVSSSCQWNAWSACSATCGGGTRTRTNTCGSISPQTEECNMQACSCTPNCPSNCGENNGCGGNCPNNGGCSCSPSCSPSCGQADGCGGTCPNTGGGACGCVPSCGAPFCGQSNGCGSLCPNTDGGTPTTPVVTPANGGTVIIDGSGNATVSWAAVTGADLYYIDIYPSNSNCTDSPTYCGLSTAGTNYTFAPLAGQNSYTFTVSAANTTCGTALIGSWSSPATFTIMANITGTFYEDTAQAAVISGGICTLGGTPSAVAPGTGASMTAVGSTGSNYTTPGVSGTTFSLTVPYWPSGNNLVTLNPGDSGGGILYACTCPNGCTYSGIASPQTGVNFYILPENLLADNWWQVISGNAYAGSTTGTTVYSPVPDPADCNDGSSCTPFISANDANDSNLSAGLIITGGGTVDSQRETGNQQTAVSEQSSQLFASGTTASRFQEKYEYFYRKFTFQNFVDNGVTPAGLANGEAYFYSGDLTLDDPWTIAAGQEVIILVNGNLTLSDPTNVNQLITVEEGGFLAIVVSGNITVSETLGNEDLTSDATNLEGIYIADGTLTIASRGSAVGGDDRFVGAGSFIGWAGVALDRDFRSDADISRLQETKTAPSELFIFRPDLVRNIPEAMTSPRYIWQETN